MVPCNISMHSFNEFIEHENLSKKEFVRLRCYFYFLFPFLTQHVYSLQRVSISFQRIIY